MVVLPPFLCLTIDLLRAVAVSRVNYIYLFDFDPRIVSSPLTIFNEAVDNTLVFLWCMLLYYKVLLS